MVNIRNRSASVFFERMFLLSVIICRICNLVHGEELQAKKLYTSDIDSLWSRNIYIQCLSHDGRWVAFSEVYDTRENVMVLMNTGDSTSFRMRYGSFSAFSNDSNWFGSISSDGVLEIVNLRDYTIEAWQGIRSYFFSHDGEYFAALKTSEGDGNSLVIVCLNDFTSNEMKEVIDYKWHPYESIISACLTDKDSSNIILYNAITQQRDKLAVNECSDYSRLLWSDSGNALVFLEQTGSNNLIHHYSLSDSTLSTVSTDIYNQYSGSEVIVMHVSLSDDGATVILFCVKEFNSLKNEALEIWDTDKPWIYPRLKKLYDFQRPLYLVAWDVRSGHLYKITDEETPDALYNPNLPNTLVYDRLKYEPQYKQDTDVDLFISNYRTGDKQLISCKQYLYRGFVKQSPTGRYTAFFKENDWWIYDSEAQHTVCLTEGLGLHFEKVDDDPKDDKEPYGNPGWSENEEFIILYDRYDIWLMTTDGSNRYRITQGRERQIQYRISLELIREDPAFIKSLAVPGSFVLKIKDGLILEMTGDDLKSGYAFILGNAAPETLDYGPGKAEEILMSSDRKIIVFKRSRFNIPSAIYAMDMVSKEIRLLYQSNAQLLDYDLGEAELVRLRDGKKGYLSGSLIYPAHFNPERKYPMIVWIYEKNARLVNSFTPPSDYEYAGFNILRYITNGYFVLLPDIEYTIGEPGISALKTVTGLTEEVLRNKFIDKCRVGLIGHSFGGYEAAFIATRTKLFRTVVAGAPITDLASWYHDIQGGGWDTEQIWRMENHQLRMGGSYYDLKRKYLRNSPLHNVEKLETPLLLWAGKNDYNVNWYQSIYMFMAMKRLNIEGKLLLFKDEGHTMVKPENKKRLTEEIFSWFNYYLMERRSE